VQLERRALMQAVIVAAGVLLGGAFLLAYLGRLELAERRRGATELARGSAFALEQELARSLDSVTVLAALVSEGAPTHELASVAQRLLELHGTTANLQLAENNVISHLWPLEGNERARGLNLEHHPLHGPYVRRLRETHRPQLYGPFELVQGGAGLALRTPVIQTSEEGERFWGLSSAILRLPVLLEASQLPRLAQAGLDYQLTRAGPADGPAELLTTSRPDGRLLVDPVKVEVAARPVLVPGRVAQRRLGRARARGLARGAARGGPPGGAARLSHPEPAGDPAPRGGGAHRGARGGAP
jgi:hypothetical protein